MYQDFSKYQDGEPQSPDTIEPGIIISDDTRRSERLPPGQSRTRKWPILHWKRVPQVDTADWTFFVRGEVESPIELRWDDFQSLPRVKVFSDFHCVTRWSRLGNTWEGVSVREIIRRVGVQSSARFVIAHGFDDGFTTNLPLDLFDQEDVLLADLHDGVPISADHGGPVRLVVPKLYAWKSAKWISGLAFSRDDQPGYWERNGYHARGNPWTQERHSW
ncbi:sulfite oxidase-like oxidoreductase [bacterium]|nr:sulfite oxidase-like oxidoreductase [bacterium]